MRNITKQTDRGLPEPRKSRFRKSSLFQATEDAPTPAIDVFELTKLPVNLDFFHSKSALGDEFLVWVDRDTQLPMKLSFYHASQDVSWEMFEFQWNRELGLEMFEMTIPEDYEVIEFIPTDAEEHDHQHKLDHDHDHDNHTHENDGHVDAGQHSHEGQ